MLERENFFSKLFKCAQEPLLILNARGDIEKVNLAAEEFFGVCSNELTGLSIIDFCAELIDQHVSINILDQITDKLAENNQNTLKLTMSTISKQNKLVYLAGSEVLINKQRYYWLMLHEINHALDMSGKDKKLVQFNRDMTDIIDQVKSYHDFIEAMLNALAILLDAEFAHFYEFRKITDQLESSKLYWTKDAALKQSLLKRPISQNLKKGQPLAGVAWKNGVAQIFNNHCDQDLINFYKQHTQNALMACIVIPVTFNLQFLGVIELYFDKFLQNNLQEQELLKQVNRSINMYYGLYYENRNFNLIFTSAGEGIYGVDLDGCATFINPAACHILGYQPNEVVGKSIYELIHSDAIEQGANAYTDSPLFKALKNKHSYSNLDETISTKQGKKIHVEYNCTPIFENNVIIGVVVTFVDVSSKYRFRQHIKQISSIQERYIAGEDIASLYHDILIYLMACTNSSHAVLGGTPLNPTDAKNITIYLNITDKLDRDNLSLSYIINNFSQVMQTGNTQKKSAPDFEASELLAIPIHSAHGFTAFIGLISNPEQRFVNGLLDEIKPLINTLASIMDSNRNYEVIEQLAHKDFLTKIYNRTFFEKTITDLISEARRDFYLMILDLDKFKAINDQYGHNFGDELLILFSQRILNCLSPNDLLARLGGDEFVIIAHEYANLSNIQELTTNILATCNKLYDINNIRLNCSTSIGVAHYPTNAYNFEELMNKADYALYQAKKNRNHAIMFDESLEQRYKELRMLEEGVLQAFNQERLYCVFQPQLSLSNNAIHGVELLTRWFTEEHGEVPPNVFIPIIERMGLGRQLNEYVVSYAVKHVNFFAEHIETDFILSINLSPVVHELEQHIDNLVNIISQSNVSTNYPNIKFQFEIKESSLIQATTSFEGLLKRITETLHTHNIQFSIDDFGIEYSTINRLLDYKFDMLKIDRCFIELLEQKTQLAAKAIIKALVSLAKDLDFTILAEGIETQQQADIVKKLGCNYAQGYYYCKPLTLDNLLPTLNKLMCSDVIN